MFFQDIERLTADSRAAPDPQVRLRREPYVLEGKTAVTRPRFGLGAHVASQEQRRKFLIKEDTAPAIFSLSPRICLTGIESVDIDLCKYLDAPQWSRAYCFTEPVLLSPRLCKIYLGSRVIPESTVAHPVDPMSLRSRFAMWRRLSATKTLRVPEALILNFRYAKNYYHSLIDVLSRLAWADRLGLPRDLPVIIPEATATCGFGPALLASSLFDGRPVIVQPQDRYIRCDKTHYLLPPRHSPDLINAVADSFQAAAPARALGPRIALVRQEQCVNRRQTVGWSETLALLEHAGFDAVDPATLTIGEQKYLFQNAETVVGENGAVFANMIFADPSKVTIHALIADSYITPTFNMLASTLGVDYRAHVLPSEKHGKSIVSTLSAERRRALIAGIAAA